MKTRLMLTALLSVPAAVYGQAGLQGRAALLTQIEASRAALLPVTQPPHSLTVSHGPELLRIEREVSSAKNEEQLSRLRDRFEIWRRGVIGNLYSSFSRFNKSPNGTSFEQFENRKLAEIGVIEAVRRVASRTASLAAATRVAATQESSSQAGAWSAFFDGGASNRDSVSAPVVAGVSDPQSRIKKMRRQMISWGAPAYIVDAAIKEALRQGVDPLLVLPVIWQESRFQPGAESRAGARGLMQLMPPTGEQMGVSDANMLFDVQTNLRAGIKYFRWMARYLKLNVSLSDVTAIPSGKIKTLLASNNAGIGRVRTR